ncbi:MAG: HAMP domain-containing sensor histidine kinase [Thermodesulfobacteriota bacterium]|nr:HAMP domain-containing sensor histidine kinase [Thermodesulfobacteriota bacterium]
MMKKPQTLRSRIVLYFCGYLAILLTAYSVALSGMVKISEDLAFNRQLSEIADGIARHVEESGEIPLFLPMHVTAFSGLSSMPPELRDSVTDRQPGVFEISAEADCHAAIVPIPSTGRMLYVFYNVASMEAPDQHETFMIIAVTGLGLGLLFIGWILARSVSNRILNPISGLAKEVQSLSLDRDTVALRSYTAADEVGTLAGTIDQLLKRISAFTRREREFTSHASHELRTPVTVIKGAVEILKCRSSEKDQAIRRPLARIERAVTDMEMLIDTFLLLARQGQDPDEEETCDLPTVVKKVVASYQYLLEAKPVEVAVRTADAGTVQAPSSLVTIALGNLVRNAFQHTMTGKVEILALADGVRVHDSGPGIDGDQQSGGLGLTIVARLCERMNWRFVITGAPGEGTRAELVFSSIGTGSIPAPEEERSGPAA